MGANSKIEWTDASWNPIRARHKATGKVGWHCEHATAGCEFCYAEGFNLRLGTGLPFKPGHHKDIELFLDEETLLLPLRWKKPRMIFVCSMTDLFADFVLDAWIDRMFAVMALSQRHTFQVLTKRSARMREYSANPQTPFRVAQQMDKLASAKDDPEELRPIAGYPGYLASSHGFIYSEKRGARRKMKPDIGEPGHMRVQLHRDGKATLRGDRFLVHRIILEAFVGPPPSPEAQGRHRDGDPTNNTSSNLLWGDQDENWSDSKRHGTHRRYAKLNQDQVADVRRRHAAGETGEALGRAFDVSATQIRNIAAGKQWAVQAPIQWPLANCWKGVSAERQQEADERIPDLLATPAAVRFVSAEPLLGPINFELRKYNPTAAPWINALNGNVSRGGLPRSPDECGIATSTTICELPRLDWVIVGGESGPGARPMHPAWARGIREQCQTAGVAFFFKQWGAWAEWPDFESETAESLELQGSYEHLDGVDLRRVGKKAAGRLLDGREHNGMPRPASPSTPAEPVLAETA